MIAVYSKRTQHFDNTLVILIAIYIRSGEKTCFSLYLDLQYRNICLAMRSIFVQWRLLRNNTSFRCSVIVSTSPKNTNNLFAFNR